MRGALVAAAALALPFLSGCIWPMRVPTVRETQYAADGTVTNRVWFSASRELAEWTCYPLLDLRLRMTARLWREMGEPIPAELRGEDLGRAKHYKALAPVGLCVLWIGAPFDLVADTLCLPYDLYRKATE